jgi:hypothetical protein
LAYICRASCNHLFKGMIYGERLWHEICAMILSKRFIWSCFPLETYVAIYHHKITSNIVFFLYILHETKYCRQISVNISNIKCQENLSSGNRLVLCGWTEGETGQENRIVAFRSYFSKASKYLGQYIRWHSWDWTAVLQIRSVARLHGSLNELEVNSRCTSFVLTSSRTVQETPPNRSYYDWCTTADRFMHSTVRAELWRTCSPPSSDTQIK